MRETTKAVTIRIPPRSVKREGFSPKKKIALSTVTKTSNVETKEALDAPILLSPAKNDQNATTVEKKARESVANRPAHVLGNCAP